MNDASNILTLQIQAPDEKKLFQVFELFGDMDSEGLKLVKNKLEKSAENFPYTYYVFDFSGLNYINSESIGFLMALHSHLVKMKKSLVVVSAKANVKDVLLVIGILSVIDYYDSMNDFKKQLV